MVVRNVRKKSRALTIASNARKKGMKASVFKKKKGFGVSITRKRR